MNKRGGKTKIKPFHSNIKQGCINPLISKLIKVNKQNIKFSLKSINNSIIQLYSTRRNNALLASPRLIYIFGALNFASPFYTIFLMLKGE